jgi:uncharacterized membrane protein
MGFYLALAVAASGLLAVGLLLMKSRAEALPSAQGCRVFQAVIAWIRDPLWIGGLAVQGMGYALYVAALSGAPVSLVAVMMQGGMGLFVVFAVLFLGERARAQEWAAIGGVTLAMLMLALSLGANEAEQRAGARALTVITLAMLTAGAAPGAVPRLRASGIATAVFSGLIFGLGSLYTKALTQDFLAARGTAIIIRLAGDPYFYLICAANVGGLIALQNAFHRARVIIVMPLSSALSNLVPILGGLLAFGERLPAEPSAAALRIGAFALTIVAGALLSGAH